MFRVKAKTTSVKIKDINKYIGRVWMTLSDAEVRKSKDLVLNKNKLFIETDNSEFKKKFDIKNNDNIVKKINENISIKKENKIFVAEPKALKEKESKIKVFTPETHPDIKLNLMDDVENVKVESTIIEQEVKVEEPFIPEIDEKDVLKNLVSIDTENDLSEKVSETVQEEISNEEIAELQEVLNTYEDIEDTEVVNNIEENNKKDENKYKVSKKRRGRPKKEEEEQ